MTEERYHQIWNAGLEIKKILKKANLHLQLVFTEDGHHIHFLCANERHKVRYDVPIQNDRTGEFVQNGTMTRKDSN